MKQSGLGGRHRRYGKTDKEDQADNVGLLTTVITLAFPVTGLGELSNGFSRRVTGSYFCFKWIERAALCRTYCSRALGKGTKTPASASEEFRQENMVV